VEHDAPAVMELLRHRGVGTEAGLASVADAERFVELPGHGRVLRILIEIEEQALGAARQVADDIAAVLDRAGLRRPFSCMDLTLPCGPSSNLHTNVAGPPGSV
jgi:uncharacterized protein (DUF849 family)